MKMAWSLKSLIVLGLCTVMAFAFMVKLYTDYRVPGDGIKSLVSSNSAEANRLIAELIRQRNNMSRQLNLKQQVVGQLQCEKQETVREARSETGGWCKASSQENSGHHRTDTALIPALAQLYTGTKLLVIQNGPNSCTTDNTILEGKYVGSFGDGPGRYKQLLLDTGKLKGYDAYDGAPYGETTSEGRVAYLDLTLPQYGLPMYDWIMSLEVAEHIPAQFEEIYLDNIVRHAKEGVVLSWAKPGQGGYSHVNNKPLEYVVKRFEELGFSHDPEESQKLKTAATLQWLQWNTNVYRRVHQSQIEAQKILII